MTRDQTIIDTKKHIAKVAEYMSVAADNLNGRGEVHDASKLEEPELTGFTNSANELAKLKYGTDEYKQSVKDLLGPSLLHHYENNSHHPEFYENGVDGMSLFDVMEMLCDWKAATERMNDGDINRSLEINTARFSLSPQLVSILKNTIQEFGWKK